MNDWLDELKQSKEQAIAQAHAKQTGEESASLDIEAGLQAVQVKVLNQALMVEPLLNEFWTEIVKGHPLYFNPSFMRTVRAKGHDSVETNEPAPWSGPVESNLIRRELNLTDGRYVVGIEWKIRADYRELNSARVRPVRMQAFVDGGGLKINGRSSSTPAEDVKSMIVAAFRSSVQTTPSSKRNRTRRHHHRPWYKRAWRALFPVSRPWRVYVALAVVMIVLAFLLGVMMVRYAESLQSVAGGP